MRDWTPERIAQAADARLLAPPLTDHGPERTTIDSRDAGPGALFVGLRGTSADGGVYAARALAAGAWGVLVASEHAESLSAVPRGVLMSAADPLRALQALATGWRRDLGARVIGVTGSTGKTSTKELLRALLAGRVRTVASRANFNTEIGLPLEILAAPAGTEVLVLEMGMRGRGQIAELAEIAEPDVGVIVSVGPVHLELLGTVEAIAAAKSELIAGLRPGGVAILPDGEALLAPHLRPGLRVITFGEHGAIRPVRVEGERMELDLEGRRIYLEVPFTQAHLRRNLLAAVGAAAAVDVIPEGRVDFMPGAGRGGRLRLPGGVTLIDDCYNANPMSVRAALDDLAASAGPQRRVAVLGDMLELGPTERDFHVAIGEHAGEIGVDVLVTVGPLAAAMTERFQRTSHSVADAGEAASLLPRLLEERDVVLVKGSRGVGLEAVCRALSAAGGAADGDGR